MTTPIPQRMVTRLRMTPETGVSTAPADANEEQPMPDDANRPSILEMIAERAAESPQLVDLMPSDARDELRGLLSAGKDLKPASLQSFYGRLAGGDRDEDSQPDDQ